jgi:glycosyltransferase involved in cell wall biosynthesis
MKIVVPLINGRSGNDVYFHNLKQGLAPQRVKMELVYFNSAFEFAPRLASLRFLRRTRSGDFSLVHANADHGDSFRLPSKPFIVTVHHNVFEKQYQKRAGVREKAYHFGLLRTRLFRALEAADQVVAVSHATRISLERSFGARPIRVIHNGVDTEVFKPTAPSGAVSPSKIVRLLFVGNLIRRKGADLLPRIMRELGCGYGLSYVAGLRPTPGFDQPNMHLRVVKSLNELVNLYNACDVFVFPSRLEGFGYAVAEAMACGKPVVCTNGSSLPELVVEGRGGFLCEQDNVEQFAEEIRRLGSDGDLRSRMGDFNRRRILESFTLRRMAEGHRRLYEDTLALRG